MPKNFLKTGPAVSARVSPPCISRIYEDQRSLARGERHYSEIAHVGLVRLARNSSEHFARFAEERLGPGIAMSLCVLNRRGDGPSGATGAALRERPDG